MKRFNIYILLLVCATTLFSSCERYLEKSPDANLSEQQVFSSYRNFQGYVDDLYGTGLINYFSQGFTDCFDMGDDVYSNKTYPVAYAIPSGDYMWLYRNADHNPFITAAGKHIGLWDQAWANIRRCNKGLENLTMLVGNTQQEYDLLRGQLLFFRAWNHFEVARLWGGIPYLKSVLNADDDMKLVRPSFKATLLSVAGDLTDAAECLPKDWNQTEVGMGALDSNTGRITKGAAFALKSRALLYAASPLTTKMERGVAEYDKELCEEAAIAAYEVIKLANEGVYALTSWDNYGYNFADTRSTSKVIYTTETIFAKLRTAAGSGQVVNGIGRIHFSGRFGGNGVVVSPTLNFVNMYETATGYAIADAPESDFNPLLPWKERDPRMMKTILFDGVKWTDKAGIANPNMELYSSGGSGAGGIGLDRLNSNGSITGYLIRKYTPFKVNNMDAGSEWSNFRYHCPYIRLAEMYLNYAEATNEVTASPGSVPTYAPLSAVEAINIVRRRVKLPIDEDITKPAELQIYGNESLPDVLSKYTGSTDIFRERIRNERSVELAFEGHRFCDLRRWYVSHLPKHKIRYAAQFDKGHSFYREVVLFEGKFDEKHYWFPFRKQHVEQYAGFKQNPGWE